MTGDFGESDLAAIWADGLSASRTQRQAYRDAFGLTLGQRLVLVSSTWGEDSLYGHWPELVDMLAQQLPLDNWRIAVMLHPTITRVHSQWQVRRWLNRACQDGVLTLPEGDAALRIAALVAADVVVGDHGSASLYAAAHGIPVVLADTPVNAVAPGSPISELLRLAPRLMPGDLGRPNMHQVGLQIELAIAQQDPEASERLLPMPGRQIVEDLVDVVVGLGDPDGWPLISSAPVPDAGFPEPSATWVRTDLRLVDDQLDIIAHRFPAGSLARPSEIPPDTHLVTNALTPDLGLLPMSDVVVHHGVADAERWARLTLRELPGCQLAAACDPDGWLITVPDRSLGPTGMTIRSIRIRALAGGHVFASAVHHWLFSDSELTDLPSTLKLHLAGQTVTAEVVST